MKGWTEEEIKNKNLMAPCGLYCGACGIYIATRDKNDKLKTALGNLYGTKPEETQCRGCMQADPPETLYSFCRSCKMRELCSLKRLVFMPSMPGMALQYGGKFRHCHRTAGDEKNNSDLARQSGSTGGRTRQYRVGKIGM